MNGVLSTVAEIDMRWVLVLLIVVMDVWCIGLVLRSRASARDRWLWAAVILLCPIVGCMFWYVLGPKPDMLRRRR